ncbi:MAG TPA: LysR substrate-binding domain-containing protein [Solirubrobacterales bacterium]|nr:LysR substrate-binding domain-containing protein [Solirubrobacterales bacterium]
MPLTNIALRHLRCFVVLAEELHFARAAQRLHLSQPALSQTLKQLERGTGLHLLDRTTRHVELTAEGAALRDDALRVLREFDRLVERAHETAAGQRGTLRVGFTIASAVDLVPRVLREYSAAHPDIKLEVTEFDFSEPEGGLDDNRSDVAILRPPVETRGVELTTLATEPILACLPDWHPLADREEITIEEILGEPIIAAPRQGPWRDYWLVCEHRHGEPPPVIAEVATVETELQAVAAGRGISIVAAAAARFYARPGVRFPRIADVGPCEVAVALPEVPTPAARAFAEMAISASRQREPSLRRSPTPSVAA